MKITKASKKEVAKFNITEWHGVDIEHYGRNVEWNSKQFLFKACENKEIVGTISGEHESGVIYVYGLIVAKNQRGHGIGRALMKKAELFGKKHGAHKIHLITGKGWESNKFYESLDFKLVGEIPNHHFKKDFLIYNKSI